MAVSATGASPTITFALTNTGTPFTSLVVNTASGALFAGSGLLSLPLAIFLANNDGVASSITFDPTVFATPQTITLAGSQLALTDTSGLETITGPAGGVTVSGGGLSCVFQVNAGVNAAVTGLTITGGSASSGGGLSNFGSLTLTNCTISGNSATSVGGLNNAGTLTLTNCTVSANTAGTGGGLVNSGTAAQGNTIVAGNTAGTGPDVSGIITSQGHNLIGKSNGSSGWVASDLTGTVAAPLNALLASLGNYDGSALTVALLPGSPAIDAGASGAGIPVTDERGKSRVGAPDIGAFESQGFTLAAVTGSTPQTAIFGVFTNPLAVTVTANNPLEPVDGAVVRFTVPSTGASAVLTSPVTITGGVASTTAESNSTVGPYTVTATAGSGCNTVSFSLVNTDHGSLVVDTNLDTTDPFDHQTSLREAIAYADTLAGNQTVTFDPTVFNPSRTIILTAGPIDLTKATGTLTIQGTGAHRLSISGNNFTRVFTLSSGSAKLQDVTITGGKTAGNGGGLYVLHRHDGGRLTHHGDADQRRPETRAAAKQRRSHEDDAPCQQQSSPESRQHAGPRPDGRSAGLHPANHDRPP